MNGYDIRLEDELPVKSVPATPYWSENYAFNGYDFKTGMGFIANIGRWVKNPNLWQEQFYLYMPDGTILIHVQVGRGDDPAVPTAGALRFYCDEPGGRWRIEFDGAMRRSDSRSLLQQPILETTPIPVAFDVAIDHDYPVWMFPSSNNNSHGKYHYEQLGSFQAASTVAGEARTFSGDCYRDHSQGPRQLGDYDGHVWLQIYMDDGPKFAAYCAWAKTNNEVLQILDQSVAIRRDGFGEAHIHDVKALKLVSLDDIFKPIAIDITVEGRGYKLRGEPLTTMVSSLSNEFDMFHGCPLQAADIVAIDQPVLLEGKDGPLRACLQRSMRLPR